MKVTDLRKRMLMVNLLIIIALIFINIPVYAAGLTAPSNLTYSNIKADSISLQWRDNSDNENGFVVQRRLNNAQYENVASLPVNTSQYNDSGLSQGTDYHYRIKAEAPSGEFAYSNEILITTSTKPQAPSNLLATYSKAHIVLTWIDNSNDETGFTIERKIDNGSFSTLTTAQANQTYYRDDNLLNGDTYYYRVKAINSNGVSDFSNEANAGIKGVPGTPLDLVAQSLKGAVIVTWKDNSINETKFVLERSSDKGSYSQIAELTSNVTMFSDKDVLSLGTTYKYRVKAINNNGSSSYSNEANVKLSEVISGGSMITPPTTSNTLIIIPPPNTVHNTVIIKTRVGKRNAYLNGAKRSLTSSPQLRQGKVFVPAKDIMNMIGVVNIWDAKTKRLSIVLNGKTIQLFSNRNTAIINGRSISIDKSNKLIKPFIASSGSLMVPVGFLSSNTGIKSAWNAKTLETTITYLK